MSVPALDNAARAAVMVMLLEEAQASALLARLEPDELRTLGERMIALGEIGPDLIGQAIAGFVDNAGQGGIPAHGRTDQVRALLHRAVGEVKGEGVMQRILPSGGPRGPAIELARWLTPQALIPMIRDEHPQAIAVLLVQLEPEIAAEVLHALAPAVQTQALHRVATLGPVTSEALAMLEELLEQHIRQFHGTAELSLGGPREAAEIINQAGRAAEKRIMPEIVRIDKALGRAIENEMFKFEHLFALDPQAMGNLLREVDGEVLIDALKGIEEAERDLFFRAMSSRAADGVRDEIAARGRLKLAQVVEAQKAIVAIARRLAADGVIQFGASGDDEYV